MSPEVQRLADAFCRYMRAGLPVAKMRVMLARNAAETDPNICHSHDFCDANMVMLDAWEECFPNEECEIQNQQHCARVNAAWDQAKRQRWIPAAAPAMGPKAQRLAIAKACGWEKQPYSGAYWSERYVRAWDGREPMEALSEDQLPNYLCSIDAMQSAVFSLSVVQRAQFQQLLGEMANDLSICFCECPANLWAEAFLKTLNITSKP